MSRCTTLRLERFRVWFNQLICISHRVHSPIHRQVDVSQLILLVFVAGNIALLQRGTCTFQQKVENAQSAGAIGVLIFNEGQPGRQDATSFT